MKELLDAIASLIDALPSERVGSLASKISTGESASLRSLLNDFPAAPSVRNTIDEFIVCAERGKTPTQELAAMLFAANAAYRKAQEKQSVELVWTGPRTEFVAPRMTEQVLLEVINSSEQRLFIVSFVAYSIPSVMSAITSALKRNVDVSMLLELSDEHGGAVRGDSLARMSEALRGAKLYAWRGSESFQNGRVHAKLAVADSQMCFITSANLTSYAMDKNMEAGLLIRGGRTPSQLHQHLEALVITRILDLV